MSTITLPILHFNDNYRVTAQKVKDGSIDVTQFAAMLDDLRAEWKKRDDGLTLFSGDVFSPSVQSSVSRGSHMVPVMNMLAPDVAVAGNHDFDFGYPHLCTLLKDTKFPWLLSNIIDNETSKVPDCLHEFIVLERQKVRIGFIGLVEKEWIGTVSSWPDNFEYRDMEQIGLDLSKKLRDPNGEYRCDFIIALTHSRVPNDITLAKQLFALSPKHQGDGFAIKHGVDLLLGGHDHLYFVSKGVTSWEGYDVNEDVLGAEEDKGDVLLCKSGSDFRDLSSIQLELEDTPAGSVRRKIVKTITGKRQTTRPGSRSSEALANVIKDVLGSISATLQATVCITETALDVRSNLIRTAESAAGDWFADVLLHAYDSSPCMKDINGADGVLICAGVLRGDTVYEPGKITLGDILEILPFEDSIVVIEIDGANLWEALEAALSTWPAQEGRFPVISGFRLEWDSTRPPGSRIQKIELRKEHSFPHMEGEEFHPPPKVEYVPIHRDKDGPLYSIITREYMAEGHDGFTALKGHKFLVDDENGKMMSTIVRQYLLGSRWIKKMLRSKEQVDPVHQHTDTSNLLQREKARTSTAENNVVAENSFTMISEVAKTRSEGHYRDNHGITSKEHMSDVDPFDGSQVRAGIARLDVKGVLGQDSQNEQDYLIIHPTIDGRLLDVSNGKTQNTQ